MFSMNCWCFIDKYFRVFRFKSLYRRRWSLTPAARWFADVSVWTRTETWRLRSPHGNQGLLHDGSPLVAPCTAGNTGCGPSRGAQWRAAPSSGRCTAWSWETEPNHTRLEEELLFQGNTIRGHQLGSLQNTNRRCHFLDLVTWSLCGCKSPMQTHGTPLHGHQA